MNKFQKKRVVSASVKKPVLTKEQEARFNQEFDKFYRQRLQEFKREHGDGAGGMAFRWFDEDMYQIREMKKREFAEKEKKKGKGLEKGGR